MKGITIYMPGLCYTTKSAERVFKRKKFSIAVHSCVLCNWHCEYSASTEIADHQLVWDLYKEKCL